MQAIDEQVFLVGLLPRIVGEVAPAGEQVSHNGAQPAVLHLADLHVLHEDVLLVGPKDAGSAPKGSPRLTCRQNLKRHLGKCRHTHRRHARGRLAHTPGGGGGCAHEQHARAGVRLLARNLDQAPRTPGIRRADIARCLDVIEEIALAGRVSLTRAARAFPLVNHAPSPPLRL